MKNSILTLCLLLAFTVTAFAESRPNILFLMADQMRGDSLGADGNPIVKTPNLDRLAAEGARFRCAYSSVPSCSPARSGLLTGLSPWHHGLLGAAGRPCETYGRMKPRMLTDAGYQTFGLGSGIIDPNGFEKTLTLVDYRKWFAEQMPGRKPDETGMGPNSHRGAPFVFPEQLHETAWTGDRAVEFLEQYDGKRPFFLKVSFLRPHSPYDPPQRYWDTYENVGKDAEIPKRAVGDWCERHAQRGAEHKDDLWQGDLGEEPAQKARIGYYGNITFIDDQIGRLRKVLEEKGLLDNTLIVFTSDHGDMLGDHHLWRKTYGYEASCRIPLVVRWGKTLPVELSTQKGGLVFENPVELRDILPTFLDAAKVDYKPEWFDGRSLLSLIRDQKTPWREFIDIEHATCYGPENNWTGLTDGKTKYIFYAPEGREQLFDLEKDPNELHDLAPLPEHREKLEFWRHRMAEHLSERGELYVKDGKPAIRPNRTLYSPHFPQKK